MNLRCICVVAVVLVVMFAVSLPSRRRAAAQADASVVVVVVSQATAGTDISTGTLHHAYQGYSTNFHGGRLIPFNLPLGTVARSVLDKVVLGLTQDQVEAFWIDQKIRGLASPPRTLPSRDVMMRVVASVPGSIGYLEANPRSIPKQLRVLSVDGVQPTDSDYPLQPSRAVGSSADSGRLLHPAKSLAFWAPLGRQRQVR